MYNCVLSIRITSLYGSQPSSVAFACKTATSEPEKKVSIGPRYDLSFSACTTAYLASELLVSIDSSPHLWFCAFKTATFRPNCMCLWVPDLTCDLLHANSVPSIRITSLYGSPPLSVLLCMQNSGFMTRHTSLRGSQTSSVVLSTHNSVLSTRIKRLYWFQPSPVVFSCKRASSGQE